MVDHMVCPTSNLVVDIAKFPQLGLSHRGLSPGKSRERSRTGHSCVLHRRRSHQRDRSVLDQRHWILGLHPLRAYKPGYANPHLSILYWYVFL
jgi:hypothetical protein